MITKDIIVPKAWDEVFRIVQEQYPDAILAGGALRDLDCAREPKDLDIFVSRPVPKVIPDKLDFSDLSDLDHLHARSFKSVVISGYTRDDEQRFESSHDCDNSLLGTEVHVKDGCLPVNIVYLSHDCTPQARFDRFDYGLNKIGYDGSRVFASSEYSIDKNNHRFTLRRVENPEQLNKSLDRMKKFRQKYSGWEFVVPGNLFEAFSAMLPEIYRVQMEAQNRELEELAKKAQSLKVLDNRTPNEAFDF